MSKVKPVLVEQADVKETQEELRGRRNLNRAEIKMFIFTGGAGVGSC